MTALEPLPFGAESPDELLAAYANGTLEPDARAEVERWLVAHPEWQPRLDVYRAIVSAVRRSAVDSAPPDLDDRSSPWAAGVWAAIDAQPQPRPLRTATPPPPPPPHFSRPVASRPPSRRRTQPLLLAVAAALLVAVAAASVVVAATRSGRDDLAITAVEPAAPEATASEEGDAAADDRADADTGAAAATPAATESDAAPPTTAAVEPNPQQALRDGAEATGNQQTARSTLDAVATLDLTGTSAEGLIGTDTVTVRITGAGLVEFPDRSQLVSDTTIEGGLLTAPAEQTSEIEVAGRKWVSCGDGPYVEQVAGGPEPECTALSLGASLAGPDATLELLKEAEGTIERVGIESVGGVDTVHYRFTSAFDTEDAGVVPMVVDAWLGADDDLLRQVKATTTFALPLELFGETVQIPATLELGLNLDDFGTPVDIQPPG